MKWSFPLRHSAQISAVSAPKEHLRKHLAIQTLWTEISYFWLLQFLPASTAFTEMILSLRSDTILASLFVWHNDWLSRPNTLEVPCSICSTQQRRHVCLCVCASSKLVLEITGSYLPVKDSLWWNCNVKNIWPWNFYPININVLLTQGCWAMWGYSECHQAQETIPICRNAAFFPQFLSTGRRSIRSLNRFCDDDVKSQFKSQLALRRNRTIFRTGYEVGSRCG